LRCRAGPLSVCDVQGLTKPLCRRQSHLGALLSKQKQLQVLLALPFSNEEMQKSHGQKMIRFAQQFCDGDRGSLRFTVCL
jgi:hypothetical protein